MAFIDFQFDPTEAIAAQEQFASSQMPFAQSVALNRTAFAARNAVVKQLPQKFEVRSKYLERHVKVEKSNKKQIIIEAAVYEDTAFSMYHQQFGGKKDNKKSNVPMEQTQKAGRTNSGKMKRKFYVKNLLKRYRGPRAAGKQGGRGNKKAGGKAFAMTSGGKTFIVQREAGAKRIGSGQRKGMNSLGNRKYARKNFKVLYSKDRSVSPRIKAVWNFDKTVLGVTKNLLPRNFVKALRRAIATAR